MIFFFAGFTTNKKPWVPLSSKYWFVNVKRQLEESHSHLKNFKRLMALRKSPIIKYGDLTTNVVNTWTYSFSRLVTHTHILLYTCFFWVITSHMPLQQTINVVISILQFIMIKEINEIDSIFTGTV